MTVNENIDLVALQEMLTGTLDLRNEYEAALRDIEITLGDDVEIDGEMIELEAQDLIDHILNGGKQ